MSAQAPDITNLENLREFVNRTLCHKNQLLIGAFPVTEHKLLRGDKPCGIFFCLHGPRAVKFTAVWESERNTLLFYGSTGERFQRTQLPKTVKIAFCDEGGEINKAAIERTF